jgi:Ca-activated chloride channel family protein
MRACIKSLRRLGPAMAAALCLAHGQVAAVQPVSLELVLAIDCSLSINDLEFYLQLRGIADAFRDEEVIATIMQRRAGVAVTLAQWDGTSNNHQQPPWRLLTDRASVIAFADEIDQVRRAKLGYTTGVGYAIDYARGLINSNDFIGEEKKIDISGDGRSNSGPRPEDARARAIADGTTVNGLAVIDSDPGLLSYYEAFVVGGDGAFVITADSYDDFAEAIRKKLRRELMLRITQREEQ